VAETLRDAGWIVTVFDDLSTGRRENVPEGVELVVGDIRSEALAALVRERRFDAISHHAAQIDVRRSVADPILDAETNVLATIRLLEALRETRPDAQVVFASSGGAIYGEPEGGPCPETHPTRPLSPYGCAKLAAEAYLGFYAAEYGLSVTILRYANVYGPRQNPHGEAGVVAIFTSRLLAGEPGTINGDGRQTRDYVFVADVALASRIALLGRRTGIYNVGTGVETDVVDLYESIARASGSRLAPRFGPAKPGEQRRSVVDPSRFLADFGVLKLTPLDEGIGRTVGWFRGASGHSPSPR